MHGSMSGCASGGWSMVVEGEEDLVFASGIGH